MVNNKYQAVLFLWWCFLLNAKECQGRLCHKVSWFNVLIVGMSIWNCSALDHSSESEILALWEGYERFVWITSTVSLDTDCIDQIVLLRLMRLTSSMQWHFFLGLLWRMKKLTPWVVFNEKPTEYIFNPLDVKLLHSSLLWNALEWNTSRGEGERIPKNQGNQRKAYKYAPHFDSQCTGILSWHWFNFSSVALECISSVVK